MNVHIAPVELSTSIACHSYKMDGSVPWTYSFDRTVARAVLSLCDLSREHRMNFDASIRKCAGSEMAVNRDTFAARLPRFRLISPCSAM
jgi:hypothetical protein